MTATFLEGPAFAPSTADSGREACIRGPAAMPRRMDVPPRPKPAAFKGSSTHLEEREDGRVRCCKKAGAGVCNGDKSMGSRTYLQTAGNPARGDGSVVSWKARQTKPSKMCALPSMLCPGADRKEAFKGRQENASLHGFVMLPTSLSQNGIPVSAPMHA